MVINVWKIRRRKYKFLDGLVLFVCLFVYLFSCPFLRSLNSAKIKRVLLWTLDFLSLSQVNSWKLFQDHSFSYWTVSCTYVTFVSGIAAYTLNFVHLTGYRVWKSKMTWFCTRKYRIMKQSNQEILEPRQAGTCCECQNSFVQAFGDPVWQR